MKEQALKLNILTFEHEQKPVSFSFFKVQKEGFSSLSLREAPIELKDQINSSEKIQQVYTDFRLNPDADFQVEVDLKRSTNFAKHYYSQIVRQYLKDKVDLINPNFIHDIEVWIFQKSLSTKQYNTYRVFGLRVQIGHITAKPELVIYHDGLSRILNSSITDLWEISHDKYSKVVYQGEFYRMDTLPERAKYNLNEVFPVVNKDLEIHFDIALSTNPFSNKYKEIYPLLTNFISTHLNNEDFNHQINLSSPELIEAPEKIVFHTRMESNYIQLGLENKVNVFTPKENLKQYGPYKLPENTKVKFIVIFHKDDRDYANKLYLIMKKLYKKPDGKMMADLYGTSLYDLIRINFDLDAENSIAFDDLMNPYDAIHAFIDNPDINIDTEKFQYVAIYLSPFSKLESDSEKKKIYYKVKETLLNHHITSQVIYKESLLDKKFKSYYYVNIAAAILAKVGGIPWRLDSPIKNELVIGVGAYKSKEIGVQYIGSAFSFSNKGEFQEFSCTSKSESYLLAAKIKVYIQE